MNSKKHPTELIIKPPYEDWDPNRICIANPVYHQDQINSYYHCSIMYYYKLHDGMTCMAPLTIELPKNNAKFYLQEYCNRSCDIGIHIACQLNPKCKLVKKLCEVILRDIYDRCLTYMEEYGKYGRGIFEKRYNKPVGIINEHNMADHLRYPIFYPHFSDMTNNNSLYIDGQIITAGKYKTIFLRNDGRNIDAYQFLDKDIQYIEHKPVVVFSSLFLGRVGGEITSRLTSTTNKYSNFLYDSP
jgi:hypothetical protein